jgi:hypothetical protein
LLAYKIRQSAKDLENLSRNGPFEDSDKVNKYIQSLNEELWDGNKLDGLFLGGEPDLSIWTPNLMRDIDKAAYSAFQNCQLEIGMREDKYLTALVIYEGLVSDAIKKAWPGDARVAGVLGRLKWYLALRPSGATLPIFTDSVYKMLVASLKRVHHGITEVSIVHRLEVTAER